MNEQEQIEVWQRQIAANVTLEDFNKFVVPAMRSDETFKRMAAEEAKRRGYRADKTLGIYVEPVKMVTTKGRNLLKVGWSKDILYAEFSSGDTYSYLGVPQEEFFKLTRSPFPDKLFATNVRNKFPSARCPTQSRPSG